MRHGNTGTKLLYIAIICMFLLSAAGGYLSYTYIQAFKSKLAEQNVQISRITQSEKKLGDTLKQAQQDLKTVKNEDQFVLNKQLTKELDEVHKTYSKSAQTYEALLDLKGSTPKKFPDLDKQYADVIHFLADKNFGSATTTLSLMDKTIQTEKSKLASSFSIPANVAVNNTAPSAGYRRQRVQTDSGEFLVDIIAGDLNSTRVIVDTASDSDCADNCPVLSLGDYVSRSGGYAGINGSYFCPESYPSCAGKKNSYDTLLMNKNKKYMNSDNNVYSTVPAVIFSGSSARFVSRSLEWGRDTGVDAVIANYPLLVLNGQSMTGATGNGKQDSRGPRSFVGATGSTAYIGIVHNASVAEASQVLLKMGVNGALNLDSGGSTALWNGGYLAGPGRNIPNAIVFVRK